MADQAILIGLNLLIWSYFAIRFHQRASEAQT